MVKEEGELVSPSTDTRCWSAATYDSESQDARAHQQGQRSERGERRQRESAAGLGQRRCAAARASCGASSGARGGAGRSAGRHLGADALGIERGLVIRTEEHLAVGLEV